MPDVRPYQRILALIDFDGLDGQTAAKALLLARLNQAELAFLHLIEPDGALDGGYAGGDPLATAKSLEKAAVRRLDFLAAQLRTTAETTRHALHGPRRQGFARYVRAWQPDLVVASQHHDFLADAYDVLILSASKHARHGKRFAGLVRWLGLRIRALGI